MSDLPIEDDQGRVDGLSDSRSRRLDQLAEVGRPASAGAAGLPPGSAGAATVGGGMFLRHAEGIARQDRPKQVRSLALSSRVPS